jgi:hypothetical protein
MIWIVLKINLIWSYVAGYLQGFFFAMNVRMLYPLDEATLATITIELIENQDLFIRKR